MFLRLSISIGFLLPLLAQVTPQDHVVRTTPKGGSRIRSVSIDLTPSLFFVKSQSPTPFKKLPYETAEVEVLLQDEAMAQGFISTSDKVLLGSSNYFVAIESWQRFEFDLVDGVNDYLAAIESTGTVDFETINLPTSQGVKLRRTLIKRGVAFRVVLIVQVTGEKHPNGELPMSEVVKGLTQSRNVWAKIELAGVGSSSMTESLPGAFTLLSGQEGVSEFMRQATSARQKVWDSFRDETSVPDLQVLGWKFKD